MSIAWARVTQRGEVDHSASRGVEGLGEIEITQQLAVVRQQISNAARMVGRDPGDVQLVVVSKNITVDRCYQAVAAGATCLGENRVQELLAKQQRITRDVQWHFIGHLQRNKAKQLVGKVQLIHSLDSWELAEELRRQAAAIGKPVAALVQVNVAGEATKHGLEVEAVKPLIARLAGDSWLQLQGLMTIAPNAANPETVRPVFRQLRLLAAEIEEERLPGVSMRWLSMGMTNDFQVAIEEGSTMVRIGSAIFGPRG